jgi:hypothetical protein
LWQAAHDLLYLASISAGPATAYADAAARIAAITNFFMANSCVGETTPRADFRWIFAIRARIYYQAARLYTTNALRQSCLSSKYTNKLVA